MAIIDRIACVLPLALLVITSNASPVASEQQVLLPGGVHVLDSEEQILRVNTSFDAVKLSSDKPFEDLEGYGYLTFKGYKIFDPKAAAANGDLNKSDIDCAVSSPNALYVPPKTSVIFELNTTAIAGHNVSNFFDFVSFDIKPLVAKTEYVWATINAWRIVDGNVEDVQEFGIGWYTEDGTFEPWPLQPKMFIDGFGDKVNFIEMSGEDDDGNAAAFCIDNILLDFHKPYDDE